MRRVVPFRGMVMLLVFGLIAGACSDSDGLPSATSTAPPSATTLSTTPPTSMAPSTSTSASSTTTTEPLNTQTVQVAFATGDGSDCSVVTAFEREVEATLDPIGAAFDLLVAGPTSQETAQGASSFFSVESAGTFLWADFDTAKLIVDFRDFRKLLANASTTCGSESLLSQLNTTAFQFTEVERVRYEIEGSCDTFSNWLQRDCMEYTRAGAEAADLSTNERAFGSGCIPGSGELPDGRWFGYVDNADADQLSFDLACWFSGSAAADAAAEDGEESPPANDYYVRNEGERLRLVPVAPQVVVSWLPADGEARTAAIGYADWLANRPTRLYPPGVWLEVEGGAVVSIEEQFVP